MNFKSMIFIALAIGPTTAVAQSVSLGASAVQENFDSLAGSGTSSTLPTGWYLLESGGDGNYIADTGAGNQGSVYSYGASGQTERALGTLASNSVATPMIGVRISNDTGSTLTSFELSYRGEQWRLGALGREERLQFELSTDATALSNGAWTPVAELDFVAPVTTGTAGVALNGNQAANQSSLSSALSGLSIAPGGTFWLRWRDANVGGSDDGLAIDDVVIAPAGGGVDVAPTVATTVPVNGASGVAAGSNISVTFSEPVTAGVGAFALSCDTQAQTFTQTGGPSSFTLDPTDPLPESASCEVTVSAAAISDLDGDVDPMEADYSFGFSVAAPPIDIAPTVASTTPTDNAGNVALNTTVTIAFSEPVDATDPWFTFDCTVSGAITAAVSGSDASRVLTPSAALQEAETCTVVVLAAQVLDRDGTADPMAANHSFSFGTTVGVGDYYASVDASSAAALRTTLHAVIDDHTAYPYSGAGTSTWTILEAADEDPSNPGRILDVYRNCSYEKITSRSGQSGSTTCGGVSGRRYNREHTWPNSLGFSSTTGNLGLPHSPYTDTHMLYLSDESYNADRGNVPYADCGASCGERPTVIHPITGGGGSGTYPGNSNWVQGSGSTGSFEVWVNRKGDLARAVLYMDIRYEGGTHGGTGQTEPDLALTDDRSLIVGTSSSPAYMGLLSTLIQWHEADPPDTRERARNDVVYSYQGNRNPFIDHPEWVACLFQSICPASGLIFRNGFEAVSP